MTLSGPYLCRYYIHCSIIPAPGLFSIMTRFLFSRFPNNESLNYIPLENRIVGFVYFIFSLTCIIPYLTCLCCIVVDKELRKKPTYIIVLHIGIADALQLILNGMAGGIFTFFGTTWGFTANKVVGGFMNVGWVVYTTLAHVLAFNRFICICKPHLKFFFFTRRKTEIMMVSVWAYGLLWLAAYMCPDINLVFNVYYRNWDYDLVPLSRIFWLIELLQDSFHFFMSVVWYSFSFASIRKTANQIHDYQFINENRKERKLLIQAMLICAMIGLTLVGFFAVPEMDEDKWATTASTLIWLACCGNNCAIYLIFNETLRRRVAQILLKFRKVEDVVNPRVIPPVLVSPAVAESPDAFTGPTANTTDGGGSQEKVPRKASKYGGVMISLRTQKMENAMEMI